MPEYLIDYCGDLVVLVIALIVGLRFRRASGCA